MRRIYPAELIEQGWTWRVLSTAKQPVRTLWVSPDGLERYEIDALALILEVDD